jgi:phage-related protein
VDEPEAKPVHWIGNSLKELKQFPEDVMGVMGYAIHLAQIGQKHPRAKPLKGFRGAGVVEMIDDFNTDTYRTVYAVRYAGAVYILHAFQKKSKKGIETSQQDIDLVNKRLALAEDHWNKNYLKPLKKETGGQS